MSSQARKAFGELSAAHREAVEALMTINSIQAGNLFGCACNADGPCAYHADQINRLLDVCKRMNALLNLLAADITSPMRAR